MYLYARFFSRCNAFYIFRSKELTTHLHVNLSSVSEDFFSELRAVSGVFFFVTDHWVTHLSARVAAPVLVEWHDQTVTVYVFSRQLNFIQVK